MEKLDWNEIEQKLETMLGKESLFDVYLMFNVIAPLRQRYFNGERSRRLYNEIMRIPYPRPLIGAKSSKRVNSSKV